MHKNVSIIILILIFSAACNQPLSEKQQTIETAKENFQHTLQVKTFNTEIGWGYDIYIDGKKLIHQPHIPVIQGKKGFSTEKKAHKAALLVCDKILLKIHPPAVTFDELDSLGVL